MEILIIIVLASVAVYFFFRSRAYKADSEKFKTECDKERGIRLSQAQDYTKRIDSLNTKIRSLNVELAKWTRVKGPGGKFVSTRTDGKLKIEKKQQS